MENGNRFSRCLLDQKNEESRQAKRLRRRTVLLAILIQLLVLGLLLLRPLFGAPAAELTLARFIPLPPWKGPGGARPPQRHHTASFPRRFHDVLPRPVFYLHPLAHTAVNVEHGDAPDISPAITGPPGGGFGDPNGLIPLEGLLSPVRQNPPAPPPEANAPPPKPRLVPSEIQQARLVTRIEPQYPALAKQIRLEGTVVIRAVIANDGTVESLETLSGHPLLARAAMDAIVRWRYRPTLLNGQPVEVEILITVTYRLR